MSFPPRIMPQTPEIYVMKKEAASHTLESLSYKKCQDIQNSTKILSVECKAAAYGLGFLKTTSNILEQPLSKNVSPLLLNHPEGAFPTRIPGPPSTSRMKNNMRIFREHLSSVKSGVEPKKEVGKSSRDYFIDVLSLRKSSVASNRFEDIQIPEVSLPRQRLKKFARLRGKINEKTFSSRHEVWQKNDDNQNVIDPAQLQLNTKRLTLQLRKKISQIYTPFSSRNGTPNSIKKLDDSTILTEDSVITALQDKVSENIFPARFYGKPGYRLSYRSMSSPAVSGCSNTIESARFKNTLPVRIANPKMGSTNLIQNADLILKRPIRCASSPRTQLSHQSGLLTYGHDRKIPSHAPYLTNYRRVKYREKNLRPSPAKVLPQNKAGGTLLSQIPGISCNHNLDSSDAPFSSAHQKVSKLPTTDWLSTPISSSHTLRRLQFQKLISTNSVSNTRSFSDANVVSSDNNFQTMMSASKPDIEVNRTGSELSSPSEMIASTPTRQIQKAQHDSFWCGRFMSLHDRFHNDMLDMMIADDKTYIRFQDNSKPIKRDEVTDGDSDYHETTGLQYLSDEETRRCKKSFIHLGALCVTDEAKQSLWSFQLAFARYRNDKHLLPSGGEMEAITQISKKGNQEANLSTQTIN